MKFITDVTDASYSVNFFLTCNSAYVSVIAYLKHVMRRFTYVFHKRVIVFNFMSACEPCGVVTKFSIHTLSKDQQVHIIIYCIATCRLNYKMIDLHNNCSRSTAH